MTAESRSQLLLRKRDLYAAIRLLEQDREDGVVDEAAYQSVRARYEQQAASILEALDTLPPDEDAIHQAPRISPLTSRSFRLIAGGAGLTVAVAVLLFLVAATQLRGSGQSATGSASQPTVATQQNAAVLAAQAQVNKHPGNVNAWVALGNAQLSAGLTTDADGSYLQAMSRAPGNPEPLTLHGMMLGVEGRDPEALRVLHRVEKSHPAYSRAWLLDGMISGRHANSLKVAIAAWRRFLTLQPHSSIAPTVKRWIAATEHSQQLRQQASGPH